MPVRKEGIGRPIIPPMATYISGTNKMMEEISRRFIAVCPSSARCLRSCHSLRKLDASGLPAACAGASASLAP